MNIKDKYIALPGIIFPTIFGTITVVFSVFSIVYIKLIRNKFSYKLALSSKCNLTLLYVTCHILIPILFFNNFAINTEFKPLVFLAISSLILLINKREKNIKELNLIIKIIIFYSFSIAIYVGFTQGIIFRFPDLNPIGFGFISIYVGAFFVFIFALFEDKFIKVSSLY